MLYAGSYAPSEGHGWLAGKAPSHVVGAENSVLSGCFVVPQLLADSPEIVCQGDVHLYLMLG